MAYTPINWQTGDTITAEKLNKMDNGWEVGETQLFNETITPTSSEGFNNAQLSYSQLITDDVITVSFNGTKYTCNNIGTSVSSEYGAPWSSSLDNYDFSEFPFNLYSSSSDGNMIATQTAGTFNVSASVQSTETSESFDLAVALAQGFPVVSGVTTFQEACDAFKIGKHVYVVDNSSSGKTYHDPVILVNENTFEVKFIITASSDTDVLLSGLTASSADGVLGA